MPIYDFQGTATNHVTFFHPEYAYWHPYWQKIRDSIAGEIQIKRRGESYLPKMPDMQKDEYAAFLDRAVYFNMTQRTVTGLVGSMFRRDPKITHLPDVIDTLDVSKQSQTLQQLAMEAGREVISMGRYGILVDMDARGARAPYMAGYLAENITDWTIEEIDGRLQFTEVILRELRLVRPTQNTTNVQHAGRPMSGAAPNENVTNHLGRHAKRWLASYRVLRLEPEDTANPESRRIYRQYFHTSDFGDATPDSMDCVVTTPNWRGQPFTYIPFVFIGPLDNTPDIDKSPILDIVLMNHSHYKSYAQLEHGRFYTALPVYYSQVKEGEQNMAYTVGPSVVWEVDANCTPGILEFNGQGLKFLENACTSKEDQIAALGGRLVGVERVSAGQSNNMLHMKESNEIALLLNVANVLDVAFTRLLRWIARWMDVPAEQADKITFETNKDFLSDKAGAREFRAIQLMYEAGILPIEVLHNYLVQAEVIPDWMDLEEFKTLLTTADSFPNLVDVQARQRGAPSAQAEWDATHVLVNPDVVSVRGYDSQAPAGQEPLPGQTKGGKVTAAQTMPQGLGAKPPKPVPGAKPKPAIKP